MKHYDCHTHTDCSLDCHIPMEEMLAAAYAAGLTGVAVTDHADVDVYEAHRVRPRMDAARAEMELCRDRWAGRLDVIRGIEIGQALAAPELARGLIDRGSYDFIIGSVHSVRGVVGFYALGDGKRTPENIHDFLAAYFREVEETVRTLTFDTLAHLTYPLRYIRRAVDFPVDYTPFTEEITHIMKILADRGLAYELNLKPYAPGDAAWEEEETALLRLVKAAGVERITLGTDAHVPEKIGYGLETGYRILEACGYGGYTVYHERKAETIPIEEASWSRSYTWTLR